MVLPRSRTVNAMGRDLKKQRESVLTRTVIDILHRKVAAWIVLGVMLLITAAGWYVSDQYVSRRAEERFEFEAEKWKGAIIARMHEYEQVLRGGVGLFQSLGRLVTRSEWQAYVDALQTQVYYPGLQEIGFSLWTPAADKKSHIRSFRTESVPRYTLRPKGNREVYAASGDAEPFDRHNRRASGYDMLSEPARRSAMERARDTGAPALSADVQAGFVIYAPVYRNGLPVENVEQRRAALLGFVYGSFRASNLLRGTFGDGAQDLAFKIFDGNGIRSEALLVDDPEGLSDMPGFGAAKTVQLGGRTWTVQFNSRPRFNAAMTSNQPTIIAVAGVTLALLIFAVLCSLGDQRQRALAKVALMSRRYRHTAAILKTVRKIARIGTCKWDLASGQLSISDELCRLYRIRPKLTVASLFDLIDHFVHPNDRGLVRRHAQRQQEEKIVEPLEFRLQSEDGPVGFIRWESFPEYNAAGHIVGFVGVLQDITDRKLADEKIRQNEIRFRAMIDSVKDYAIFMLDGEGRVISWNKGAERTAGFTAEEVLNQHFSIFFPIEDRGAERADEMLKNALAQGQCDEVGWRMRANGSRFWASVVVSAVDNGDGGLTGFSHVIRDLTDRQRDFEDLKLAKEQAEAANQAKTDFLANISHEIRTPMTGVIGMAGLLAETEMSPKQREYCDIIRRSGESLLTIINEVLDFSKVESGELEMEIINFDLRSAIEQVMDLFATQAEHKGIELINFMRYDVPTALQGDPGRLRQILSNLVNNALKFTARGEVVVRLNIVEQTPVIATLRFEVSDTGIGIPKDKMGVLFSRFTQVDPSITRQYGGTGLGLAICKKFVDLMNGQIGVESEPGKGSVFWFTVPLLKQRQPVQQPLKPRDDLSGLRVLVVDGSQTCRAVLGNYLEALGIVSEATDEAAATLELLETANTDGRPYDVAIIDYRLAQMTGLDLARTMRSNPKLGQLKILLLTSVGRRGDGDLARQAGIDAYLTKPIRFSLLSDCLALVTGETGDYPSALVTRHSVAELEMQKRLRLLVADDNHINQKVAVSLLERLGHRADVVNNGQEALDAFIMVPYDAVFMDLQMPQMDGYEASRRIRSQAEKTGRRTLIVAVTAHARTEDKKKCLAAGFDDYISKPIDPKELRVVIERILTSGSSEATTAAVSEAAVAREVLDFSEALSQVEGNKALLDEIVHMYQEQEPKLRDKIHRALANSNYQELADAAHTLASSAGQVGAARAQAAAKNLEHLGRQGELSGLLDALSALEAELERADHAISDQARLLRAPLDLPNSIR